MKLFGLYFLCVLLAGACNIFAQEAVFELLQNLFLAMLAGIAVSTLVKYYTNKKFVFNYQPETKKEEAKAFIIYGSFGALATLLFMAIEYSFIKFVDHNYSRQIGAIVAIVVTSYLKFLADKKYVYR